MSTARKLQQGFLLSKSLVTNRRSGKQRVVYTYYVYYSDGSSHVVSPSDLLIVHRIRAVKLSRIFQHEKAPVTIDITDEVMKRIP